jgi:hypothetical protein
MDKFFASIWCADFDLEAPSILPIHLLWDDLSLRKLGQYCFLHPLVLFVVSSASAVLYHDGQLARFYFWLDHFVLLSIFGFLTNSHFNFFIIIKNPESVRNSMKAKLNFEF